MLIAFYSADTDFGAFIGCAIGIFLTLVVNPVQAVWFTIVFFVLQQIEGNLIYPHVVETQWVFLRSGYWRPVSIGGSMMGVVEC